MKAPNFDIKQTLLQGWTLVRFIRLGLALIVSYEAFKNYDWMLAVLGALLLIQSLLNVGCCGVSGCDVNQMGNKFASAEKAAEEITFEEIKK